jgi:hypothetical protein
VPRGVAAGVELVGMVHGRLTVVARRRVPCGELFSSLPSQRPAVRLNSLNQNIFC